MADKIGRTGTITLDATFRRGGSGQLWPADPVRVDIIDPDGIPFVANASPTSNPSTGFYTYDFEVPADAKLGVWGAVWTGVIEGIPVGGEDDGEDLFEVVGAGTVTFDLELVCDVAELESFMRTSFDANASVVAEDVLGMCQSTLEAWLGRPITERVFTEDLRLDLDSFKLYLPATPVVSIESLAIDGAAALTQGSQYVVRKWGADELLSGGEVARVTWTAGIDGRAREHSALRFAVMRAAAREMKHWQEDDRGLQEVRSEGYAAKFMDPDSVFTQRELAGCIRYKRRRIR